MDPISLALAVGGSIISGVIGNQGAQAQADATNRATDIQNQQFQQSQALLKPQIDTGNTARDYASGLLGLPGGVDAATANKAFTTSPDYNFRLQQGTNAIDQSAVNRGTLNSGATLKALDRYGQGIGGQEFGSYYDRLMGLAGGGSQATGQAINLGSNYADNASNIALGQGQQRASSYTNLGNNIGNLGMGLAGLNAKYGSPLSAGPQYAAKGQPLY